MDSRPGPRRVRWRGGGLTLAAALGLALAATARAAEARRPAGCASWLAPAVAACRRVVAPDSLAQAIGRELDARAGIDEYPAHRWQHVRRLYAARRGAPLWTVGAGASRRALTLLDTVSRASAQALRLDGYPLAAAREALATLRHAPDVAARARAEVLLTATYVAYAEDLLTGQIAPRSVNRAWHIDPHDVDVDSALTRTVAQEPFAEALAGLRPQDPDYERLVAALARYRAIVIAGGWPRVPEGPVLRPGDATTADRLGALLARLHAEEFVDVVPLVPAPNAEAIGRGRGPRRLVRYDTVLAAAVATYQRRHALAVDSVVGPNTLAALNRPATYRLQQIAANLERHRWLPRTLGDRYVLVNVPAFRLHAYDAGREALTMNVVVGAEYGGRSTPVFSDSMAYVVFRPYWNVPDGIAERELWPKQRRDPSYFRRNGYEVVHARWGTYVRQRPGASNALGDVKFIFPNDFNIYLHDTPAGHLFAEPVRAFSHGCIRVERPDDLAAWVLGWSLDRVHEAMTGPSDNRRVNLADKLPVYVVYFTAYTRDGALHFGNDIYDRDDALVGSVGAAAMPAARQGADTRG